MDIFTNNMFFGLFISLIAFEIGLIIYRKTKLPIFNPLLIAIILVIGFLKVFNID
ncbi:LrgB family protein, partial [Clostridium saudiense]|nr:LrgB family protein [Clostridium saudiense]